MRRATFAVFVLLVFLSLLSCGGEIVVLSYNVENLFDDRDEGREYPEYSGEKWSEAAYRQKLTAVARALKAASSRGADILCLQEIESEVALRDLRDRHLKNLGYRHLVFVPQAGAATGVAYLSRLPILRSRAHEVGSFDGVPLRRILEIQVEHRGSVLYLFNNHWKSKSGGVERTAAARRQAARVLTSRVRAILDSFPEADVLVVGDLNENLEDFEAAGGRYATATAAYRPAESHDELPDALFITSVPVQAGVRQERVVLYDPWYEIAAEQRGSSAYQGRWQTPDRILLSAGLFDREGFFCKPGDFAVVRKRFLIDPQSGFPRRWRPGAAGEAAGTSDHLPLRLTVRLALP